MHWIATKLAGVRAVSLGCRKVGITFPPRFSAPAKQLSTSSRSFSSASEARSGCSEDPEMAVKKKGGFYAVHRGHQTGVYHTWEDAADPSNRATCKAQIDGFPGAVYKKFATLQEAEDFVANGRAPTAASGSTAGGKQATSAQNPRLAVPYQRPSGAGPSVSETSSAKAQAPHPLGGPDVIAWCDGSCLNNGRTDVEVRAGSGVFWEQVPGGPQVPQCAALKLAWVCRP